MARHLAQGDEPHQAVGRIAVLERGVDALVHLGEQLGAAEVLPESEPVAAAAARTDETVAADQRDRHRGPEIDAIVELGEMLRIERGDDDAAEAAVAVLEAAGHLDRPFAAGAPDHRLADVEDVLGMLEMELVVIAIAQIDRLHRLRSDVRRPGDAVAVDDRHLDDDLAEHVGGVHDGGVVRRILASSRCCGACTAAPYRPRPENAAHSPRTPARNSCWRARPLACRRRHPRDI